MNTGHPWLQASGRDLLQLYKLWYQAVLAAPVVGRRAALKMVEKVYDVGVNKERVSPDEWRHFVDQFREPERANATVQIYRTFLTREMPGIARGRYADTRLEVPTLYLHGEHDPVVKAENFEPVSRHADDFRIEIVPDAGHFVAEEAPEAVLKGLLGFFGAGPSD